MTCNSVSFASSRLARNAARRTTRAERAERSVAQSTLFWSAATVWVADGSGPIFVARSLAACFIIILHGRYRPRVQEAVRISEANKGRHAKEPVDSLAASLRLSLCTQRNAGVSERAPVLKRTECATCGILFSPHRCLD